MIHSDLPKDKQIRSQKLFVFWQLCQILLVLAAYSHLHIKLVDLRSNVRNVESIRMKRSGDDRHFPQAIDDYTIIIGHDTIIPKSVLERSCSRIHGFCSDAGKKLVGFQGPRGAQGTPGPVGPPGRRGSMGSVGPAGLVGDAGEIGEPGRTGRCNCSFPDMYVQRVAVPGPPVVQIEEKMVPVPVVVVKEVEVTKLVPFEPTPPGFGPPPGWSPGMPRPDLSRTRKLSRFSTLTTSPTPPPGKRRRTTVAKPFVPPVLDENGTLIFGNFTDIWGNYTNVTTPEPYTGPPTFGYNKRECMLAAVGIPVLHAESQYGKVGSWMRDTRPSTPTMAGKRWVTDGYASPVLYEYENERQMMNKVQKIKYYVDYLASGTGNIIYNGSYFYHKHGTTFLVRYDLETTDQIEAELDPEMAHIDCGRLPDHTFEECNDTERHPWLYDRAHNYVDFAVDENGLWVVYMHAETGFLMSAKIEEDFYIVKSWEISDVNATELADTFIVCGVLYGLQNATARDSVIDLAYDLYRNESIPGQVSWYNPYNGLTMLHYNPVDSRLYFYDDRRLLSVNVRMEEDVEYYYED